MIGVVGAGAFGTALAIALAPARLFVRDAAQFNAMAHSRENARYLPSIALPRAVLLCQDMADLGDCSTVLLALPMQSLAQFMQQNAGYLVGKQVIACCKGLDLAALHGPSAVLAAHMPQANIGVLTGPSFAADIARGLPTALTLAHPGPRAQDVQAQLSTPNLRLYLTDDVVGAELGGALKNVIALAAGVVMGAGLGASARAAMMTRGFVEMQRAALALGGRGETLNGLSGFGDLVLTCTSAQSRNFQHGFTLGAGDSARAGVTVEGVATAAAMATLAQKRGLDMPITQMMAALIAGQIPLQTAITALMSRPLKKE